MNSTTATATLQHYVPSVFTVLADDVMLAFLLGLLTALSMVSTSHLIHRGVKQPSIVFMLVSLIVLYASTATYFGVQLVYSAGYIRLLNHAVTAISSEASLSSNNLSAAVMEFCNNARTEARIISVTLVINVTVGDIIVWWRLCVLWRKKYILALGTALISCTLGFGILSSVHWQITVDTPPLLAFDDVYGEISYILSLLTNVVATLLIGKKAWKHRQLLRQSLGSKGRFNTPVMKMLTLLVESGIIYCIILSLVMFTIILSRSKLAQTPIAPKLFSGLTISFSGCFMSFLALYPTIIIFIVSLNRSSIDGCLADLARPSSISTDMQSTLVFWDVSPDTSAVSGSSEEQSIDGTSSIAEAGRAAGR